jgi:hypothetical protein
MTFSQDLTCHLLIKLQRILAPMAIYKTPYSDTSALHQKYKYYVMVCKMI